MITAHILYYAAEDCHRPAILRGAGYEVRECFSERLMAHDLAEWGAELVCISEPMDKPAGEALAMARAFSNAPVVLFRNGQHHYAQSVWELEVAPLTHPSLWFADIAALLSRTRAGLANAKPSRETPSRIGAVSARSRDRPPKQREEVPMQIKPARR